MCRSETSFLIVPMILARSLRAGTWVDVADIDRVPYFFALNFFLEFEADGVVAWAFQFEAGPIVRNRLCTVRLEHVSFGRSHGMRDRVLLSQMSVETLHQIESPGVVDAPERGNDSLRTSQ